MCYTYYPYVYAAANSTQCRAFHAGQKFFVEVDIVMDEEAPLKITHDVSQTLQRKLEGQFASFGQKFGPR